MPLFKRHGRLPILKVSDVMSSPPVTIAMTASVDEAAVTMWEKRVGSLLVVDGEGRLAGIITERDVIFAAARSMLGIGRKVSDLMSRNLITTRADDSIAEAIEKMRQSNIRHIPVMDEEGRPIGMLSIRDVLDAAAQLLRVLSPLE